MKKCIDGKIAASLFRTMLIPIKLSFICC